MTVRSIDAVVNGFVRHAMFMAFGVKVREHQGDLLRRPAQMQEMLHHAQHQSVGVMLGLRTGLTTAMPARLLGADARVAVCLAIAPKLPADRAGRPLENPRHGTDAVALLLQAGDCNPVFSVKVRIAFRCVFHVHTLLELGVLHFTFESAHVY